jgi:hypothetical protein
MVQIGFSFGYRKPLQSPAETFERLKDGKTAEVQEGHADVIGMMKLFIAKSAILKSVNELFVVHDRASSRWDALGNKHTRKAALYTINGPISNWRCRDGKPV